MTFEASLVYSHVPGQPGLFTEKPCCLGEKKVPMKSETAIDLVWLRELLDKEYSFLQEQQVWRNPLELVAEGSHAV